MPNTILPNTNLQQVHDPNVIKVVVMGVESTGKTTLCQDLATAYGSTWVVEYMRPYLKQKWQTPEGRLAGIGYDDLLPIAKGQIHAENQATAQLAKQANHNNKNLAAKLPLFCDTCLFELMVYAHWYQGRCPSKLKQAALSHRYDMVLLTKLDVPWQADGIRDSPYERNAIHDVFVTALNTYGIDYHLIGGGRDERVTQVKKWLSHQALLGVCQLCQ